MYQYVGGIFGRYVPGTLYFERKLIQISSLTTDKYKLKYIFFILTTFIFKEVISTNNRQKRKEKKQKAKNKKGKCFFVLIITSNVVFFFYVLCPFEMLTTMAIHNFLSCVTLNDVCFLLSLLSASSSIHINSTGRYAVRFPCPPVPFHMPFPTL